MTSDAATSLSTVIDDCQNVDDSCFGLPEMKTTWTKELADLVSICTDFSSFAPQFDYSSDLKYNGFRSYIKMVAAHFGVISKTLVKLRKNVRSAKRINKLKALQGQTSILLVTGKSMKKVQLIVSKLQAGKLSQEQFIQRALENKIESIQESEDEKLLGFLNSSLSYPWLPKWFRDVYHLAVTILYVFTGPLKQPLGIVSKSSLSKYHLQFVSRATVASEIRDINRLVYSGLFKKSLAMVNVFNFDTQLSHLTLKKRQKEWIIDENSNLIAKFNGEENEFPRDGKKVKCILNKPRNYQSKDLILFVHGGGFIVSSARMYDPSIQPLVKATNTAVLSIEYTLAPEAKYPLSLQECLDVYLNLISQDPITGFKPERIILMGDSAGGHMVTAMSIAIAEIRQNQISSREEHLVPLPKALHLIYPFITCCIGHFYPSRTFNDFLCFQKVYFLIGNSYCGTLDEKEFEKKNNSIWHTDENILRKVGSRVNSRMNDPFIHLPGYKHFDRLKDVPLYIQVGEFDPFLDGSIFFAKLWKGPVTLDVIPEVSHGWLSFDIAAPKSFTGCQLMYQRVIEVLQGPLNNSLDANKNSIAK